MTDARKRLEAAGIVRQEDWPQSHCRYLILFVIVTKARSAYRLVIILTLPVLKRVPSSTLTLF